MDEYKEVVLDEKKLYGGSHTLKIWIHGTKSGFIVRDCIHKSNHDFEKFEDAKIYFNGL